MLIQIKIPDRLFKDNSLLARFVAHEFDHSAIGPFSYSMRGKVITMSFRSKILTLAIAILPALAASAPAATVDMRSITCGDYLAMPAASANKFSAWMTGWFSYQTNKTYVDFDIHRANVASVRTWCQGHGTASVMSALENPVVVKGIADPSTDFNKITCGKWLAYRPDDREFVTYFMSGYYNANASNSILDYDRLQKNLTAVSTYCSKNKSRTLPTAIQAKAT